MDTKIIEILDMIARGDEPPKKIIFRDEIYEYDKKDGDYRNQNYEGLFDYYEITDILNETVTILEITIIHRQRKAKIEKIDRSKYMLSSVNKILTEEMIVKINQLIDGYNEELEENEGNDL